MPAHREIYNVFINPALTLDSSAQRRVYAAFDMAPTLLESAGARLPEGRYGLGTSLFRPGQPTLLEAKGVEYYEAEIHKESSLYRSFFQRKTE